MDSSYAKKSNSCQRLEREMDELALFKGCGFDKKLYKPIALEPQMLCFMTTLMKIIINTGATHGLQRLPSRFD